MDLQVRRFATARAFDWLAEGWRIFRAAPRQWLLAALVALVILLLLGSVPRLGQVLANFASLLVFGGLLQMARDVDEGRVPPLSRLFAALQTHLVPVLLTTLIITLIVSALLLAVVVVAGGGAMLAGMAAGQAARLTGFVTLGSMVVIFVALMVLVSGVFWFAPGLVVLRDMKPMAAVRQSLRAFVHNWGAMLLLAVMFFGLGIAAMLPFGLGWLVLLPVVAAASYASIKDVFA